MPFHIDEKFIQSDWNETDIKDPSYIIGKPPLLKGEPGNDGEKGQKGEIGPRGIEGEKGEQGVDGSKGQKGEIGVGQKGQKGELGIDGSKGQKGEQGLSITGEKGEPSLVKGQKGEKGEKGELGITGDTGQKGQKGEIGETGQKGQKGEIGNIGVTGQKGQKGEIGAQGEKGINGQKGEIGLTGDKGQKGEVHSSKFVNNGSLNSSDEIELVYDDGSNMTNKIDISALRELPTMYNTDYGKRLTVVQPSSGSGVEAQWHNRDTYSFSQNRTLAQLEVQKVEQTTTSPYANQTTTNTYNFLPALVNDKVLSVANGGLTWVDFPADDNTRVTAFAIDSNHQLSLSQNDGTTPYSVNLSPYLDNKMVTSGALNNVKTHIDLVRTSPLANVSIDIRPILVSSGVISGSDILMKYDDYDAVNNPSSSFTIDITPLQNQNKLPTTTTEDQFTTSTTTADTWQICTKLSLNPVRFGDGTTSSIHNSSTIIGVESGVGPAASNINTCVGFNSGKSTNGLGTANTFLGFRAGHNSRGNRNTFMGHLAGYNNQFNSGNANDNFALGEGSMDGGTCDQTTGIGRYCFRGATTKKSIGLGQNVMGSGFGFHTYATNSVQRSGDNKFLVGHNTNTNYWTTNSPYTGSPYLLDGTMGGHDAERELKINANDIYFGSSLPTTNSTPKQIWNDQGVLRYGAGSALAYTDTVFSLPSQTNEADGLLTTNGVNVSWSTPYLSVQSTGATIGKTTGGAKSLSFESNVTSGTLGRINTFIGGNISSSIIFDGNSTSNYDSVQIRVRQGINANNPLTIINFGAVSSTDDAVTIFGSVRSILDNTIGKEDTMGVRKLNFRTKNDANQIAEINVYGRDANSTESQYCKDEYRVGQNTTGSLYGYSSHLRKTNNSLTQMLRLGKNISTIDSFVEAYSTLKIVGLADHRLILGDFTAQASPGRIDIKYNSNTGLIGETNYRALDNNSNEALYGQTYCSLSSNNPIYGTYYIKAAQGGAIGSAYLARFGRIDATSNNEDIDFNGVVGVDTLRFTDGSMMTTAPQIKNTFDSGATLNGNEIYNAYYINTVRGIDLALINTKLDTADVKNTLQTTALFAGTEVYNCWYHDTARQLDAQVVATKLDSTYVKNVLQTTALFAGLEVYNCWYHDTARQLDAQVVATKLDSAHIQTTYQATPNTDDIYDCSYLNNYLSTASVGYKNLSFKSSNTTTGLTMGITDAYSGTDRLTAITHDIANSTTKAGKIEFFTFDNTQTHGVVHKAMYLQDAKVYLNHLNAVQSITLDSPSITSNIINKCPGTPQIHIESANTASGAIVLGNYKTFGQITTTASVQYPPTLSSNTSTVLGITYTLTSSSNAFVGAQYDRYKAFDRNNGTGWHSSAQYNNGNGANTGDYQGSNSLGGVSGEWLKLHMSTALPFGSVKIIGRNGYDAQSPDDWEILASTNGTNWTSILSSTVAVTYNGGNGHTFTINNTTAYNYYAIVAKAVKGPSSAYAVIHEVQFFTVATNISSEFSDIRTTKYSGNYGTLNLRVKQNGSMSNLITIGKQQAADTHDIIFEGDTSVNGILSSNDLRITGTGSKITFNSGQEQTDAITTPASNLDGYRLTANSTGGWTWSPPDVYYDGTDRNINIGPINSSLGVDSISIGYYAGQIDTSRSREQSIFIGTRAGQNTIPTSTDTGLQFDNVVMIGHQAGQGSIYCENSVLIGSNAGGSAELNPHSNSNFIGSYAGHDVGSAATGASSYSNGFFGTNAGRNYVGIESQGFGRDCLYTYQKNTTQRTGNNAMGATSMRNNVGSFNCAQGSAAMRWDGSGAITTNHNVALGADCMGRLTNTAVANSNDNVFIGSQSARILSGNAVGNVGIGRSSFYQGVGSKNVMLGNQAGYQHNGSNCIYIGENQGYQQTESNKLKIGTYQNQQIISGVMGSTSAASELAFNAKRIDLPESDLPTAYDSTKSNQLYIGKNGELKIGVDKSFFMKVSGNTSSTYGKAFTTFIFPNIDENMTDTNGNSYYNTTTGELTLPYSGVYFCSGTMRSKDANQSGAAPAGTQWGVGIHTSNNDGSHFLWHTVNTTNNVYDRSTYAYSKVIRYNANDKVRTILYMDDNTARPMSGGEMVIYRLSD